MKAFLAYVRQKVKYNYTMELYSFLYSFGRKQKIKPVVVSIEETIEKIIADQCSVSRFGDGEMLLVGKKPIRFQKKSNKLSERLIEVLESQNFNHLVCISDTFDNLNRYNRSAVRFWRTHFYLYGKLWDQYLVDGRTYYNTFITRPYMDFKSKDQCGYWFDLLKKIWNDRDIVFVEGEKSRLGVGNDLFSNAKSIKRILCPPTDAFDKYDEILNEASKQSKDALILIALGPTATVLAYDLYKQGFQAIDAGHVDIEYEWYRMHSKRKTKIPSKYVNESFSGRQIGESIDSEYQKQVICIIH